MRAGLRRFARQCVHTAAEAIRWVTEPSTMRRCASGPPSLPTASRPVVPAQERSSASTRTHARPDRRRAGDPVDRSRLPASRPGLSGGADRIHARGFPRTHRPFTDSRLAGRIARDGVVLVLVEARRCCHPLPETARASTCGHLAGRPANVIYTSGSTRKTERRDGHAPRCAQLLRGMDARVPHGDGDAGSGDEPVLRHFRVDAVDPGAGLQWCRTRRPGVRARTAAGPALSLFYFASDGASGGAETTVFLLEGAKFADREGFAAVWTPERHFH